MTAVGSFWNVPEAWQRGSEELQSHVGWGGRRVGAAPSSQGQTGTPFPAPGCSHPEHVSLERLCSFHARCPGHRPAPREAWEMREGSRPRAPNLAALQSTGQSTGQRRPAPVHPGMGAGCALAGAREAQGGGPSLGSWQALCPTRVRARLSPGEAGSHREEEAARSYPPPHRTEPQVR